MSFLRRERQAMVRGGERWGLGQVKPAGDSVQDPGPQEGMRALSSEGPEGTREEEWARSGGFAGPGLPGVSVSRADLGSKPAGPHRMGQLGKLGSGPGEAKEHCFSSQRDLGSNPDSPTERLALC